VPLVVLDENACEAFERTEHGAVDHHRHGFLAIGRYIERAEPQRHVEVDLDSAALPIAPNGVAQYIFELWPVKSALARVQLIGKTARPDGALERRLCLVPNLVGAHPLLRTVRELDAYVLEAEVTIDRQHLLIEPHAFLGNLILGRENMRVVLREVTHAQQTMQRARRLVAMHLAELRKA